MLDRQINLLIIEDTQTDAELLIRRLKQYEFELTYNLMNSPQGIEKVLVENEYDIVISDYNLPKFNGIDVLKKVKSFNTALPFIMLSGSINRDQETQILKLGANEVILKSNLNRLPFSIRRILYEVEDRKKLHETKQKLEESLAQMEVLLKEVHHRVKNNLQVISSLLELRQMESDDKQVKRITADLLLKIRSIGIVHEKLYQSHDLANINLPDLIQDLTTYTMGIISDHHHKYDLHCDIDPIHLNVNQAVPCGLIISELIYNAVQHAFGNQDDCRINVAIKEKGTKLNVSVTDNGNGLPESFSFEDANGLGSKIISTLFKQLNADYEIQNRVGTSVMFSFDKKQNKGSQSAMV